MEKKRNLKLCNHCDGQIDINAAFCPYCGTEVRDGKNSFDNPLKAGNSTSMSVEETLSSLYPPPYQPKGLDAPLEKEAVIEEDSKEIKGETSLLWPILFLSVGFNFLLIGLFLLLFSGKGVLIFKWNTHIWFIYVLIAAPLLYLGYKKASKLK